MTWRIRQYRNRPACQWTESDPSFALVSKTDNVFDCSFLALAHFARPNRWTLMLNLFRFSRERRFPDQMFRISLDYLQIFSELPFLKNEILCGILGKTNKRLMNKIKEESKPFLKIGMFTPWKEQRHQTKTVMQTHSAGYICWYRVPHETISTPPSQISQSKIFWLKG